MPTGRRILSHHQGPRKLPCRGRLGKGAGQSGCAGRPLRPARFQRPNSAGATNSTPWAVGRLSPDLQVALVDKACVLLPCS
jgi:hypothetical protein